MVIRPAVSGVENVLRAVNSEPSVERVVLTSSVAAVVGDHWERGREHVYTEADWNQTATQTFLPYHRQVPDLCDFSSARNNFIWSQRADAHCIQAHILSSHDHPRQQRKRLLQRQQDGLPA